MWSTVKGSHTLLESGCLTLKRKGGGGDPDGCPIEPSGMNTLLSPKTGGLSLLVPVLKPLGGLLSTTGLVDRLVRTAAAMTSSIPAFSDSFLRGTENTHHS